MIAYLIRRFLLAVMAIQVISVLSFLFIHLPGGTSLDAIELYVNEETWEEVKEYYGLAGPMHVRYGKWMWRMLHGDPGDAYVSRGGRVVV